MIPTYLHAYLLAYFPFSCYTRWEARGIYIEEGALGGVLRVAFVYAFGEGRGAVYKGSSVVVGECSGEQSRKEGRGEGREEKGEV